MKRIKSVFFAILSLCLIYLIKINFDPLIFKSEISGTYIYNRAENTFDTLVIYNNGSYRERLYDKSGKLVVERNSKWRITKDSDNLFYPRIHMNNMILNEDRQIFHERNYLRDRMGFSSSVDQVFGVIRISVTSDLGFYYVKL